MAQDDSHCSTKQIASKEPASPSELSPFSPCSIWKSDEEQHDGKLSTTYRACATLVVTFWSSYSGPVLFFIHLRLMKCRCGCYDDANGKTRTIETVAVENGGCRGDCLKIDFGLSGLEKEKRPLT